MGQTFEKVGLRLVVDANVLLAGVLRDSTTRSLLLEPRLQLVAPDFLFSEVSLRISEDPKLCRKTQLGVSELLFILEELSENILFIERSRYDTSMPAALSLASHEEDAPYLATALLLNCPLWSNDSDMKKQARVPVLTTAELIKRLC